MDTRKIIQALAYFASKQPDGMIDNMKAYKLLWLADRYHIRHYGRTISGDSYYAMPKGPVPSDAKSLLENQTTHLASASEPITSFIEPHIRYYSLKAEPNTKVFSETDINAMNLILDAYNAMTAEELSELSHKFPEWKYYETRLKDENENNSFPIKMSLMFENHDDGTGLFVDDEELLSLTQSLYTSRYGH